MDKQKFRNKIVSGEVERIKDSLKPENQPRDPDEYFSPQEWEFDQGASENEKRNS